MIWLQVAGRFEDIEYGTNQSPYRRKTVLKCLSYNKKQEQLHGEAMRVEANLSGHPLEMRSIANDSNLNHSVENN